MGKQPPGPKGRWKLASHRVAGKSAANPRVLQGTLESEPGKSTIPASFQDLGGRFGIPGTLCLANFRCRFATISKIPVGEEFCLTPFQTIAVLLRRRRAEVRGMGCISRRVSQHGIDGRGDGFCPGQS